MVALLVSMSVMAVMLSVAMPVWKTMARREKEAELVFRGEQYARAIAMFQQRVANAAPPSLDVLVEQRFLRKKYKDPITGEDFGLVLVGQSTTPGNQSGNTGVSGASANGRGPVSGMSPPSQGGASTFGTASTGAASGIIGVVSKSKAESLRLYNGRNHYNEWVFTPTQRTQAPGAVGGQPGVGGAVPGVGGQPARGGRGIGPAGFGGRGNNGRGRGLPGAPAQRGPNGPTNRTNGPNGPNGPGGPGGPSRFGGLPPQTPSQPPRR
jgi:type II secretory pathway pseudopilin PulG